MKLFGIIISAVIIFSCSESLKFEISTDQLKDYEIVENFDSTFSNVFLLDSSTSAEFNKITSANIDKPLKIYFNDNLIIDHPITAPISSGIIQFGKYENYDLAMGELTRLIPNNKLLQK